MSLLRSIRNKLLLVVLLTTFFALAVAGGFILLYDMKSYRTVRENDMTTQIRLLAYSSIPALQFEDPEVATQNLDLLRLRPSVRAAALYDARGELFTTYSRGATSTLFPAGPGAADLHTLDQSMFIFEPITENGEFLGTAYLQADYLLRDRVLDFFGVLGLVTLGSMSAAVLVSLWLQRFITRPLLSVASIARDVVNRKEFTRRAQKESEDEVGVLVDAFNDMLEEIQKLPIRLTYGSLGVSDLQEKVEEGGIPIVLISSYRIYQEKFPHWVVVTGFDERYVYVHDPFVDQENGKTETDCVNMPILKKSFERMARYGKAGQKAVLILRERERQSTAPDIAVA